MDENSTHGGVSPIWSSAMSAALGDGMVPRTATVAVTTRQTTRRWPWQRKDAHAAEPKH